MSLEKFRIYLEARGSSQTTIKRYIREVERFLAFTKGSTSKDDIMRFLASKKSGTHKQWLYSLLKSFYNAIDEEWTLMKAPAKSQPKRPYFTLEETEKILKTVDETSDKLLHPFNLRDRVLIHVGAITFCRRKELMILDREDYRDGHLHIKTAKKGEPRWRLLDPETRKLMEEYLASRKDSDPAMFIGGQGRLSLVQLSRILKLYLKKAGVYKPRSGFHSFRRGGVTILHKRGMSEKEIQEYGGWKSPFMVHEYIQLEPMEVEEKVKETHPFFLGERTASKIVELITAIEQAPEEEKKKYGALLENLKKGLKE